MMCLSFSLCVPSKAPFSLHHRFTFSASGNPLCIRTRNPKSFSISASIAEKNSALELSWDGDASDDYNGWAVVEEDMSKPVGRKGLSAIGVGASALGVVGLLAYFSFSGKVFGFRFRSPFSAFHGGAVPSCLTANDGNNSEEVGSDFLLEDAQATGKILGDASESSPANGDLETSLHTVKEQKFERVIVPFMVDSAQQEAFFALKKLKIIEDDVRANELCTRREYARWLGRANTQLERNRKLRINSAAALCGSRIAAFDDVGVEDLDFEYIQTLAEAGIVRSKLSNGNSGSNPNHAEEEHGHFSPERLITRQELVSWRVKLEYETVLGASEETGSIFLSKDLKFLAVQMSRWNIGFLDVKEISSNALAELYTDILAGEKSIIRGVFGQSKRLQPSKPCTRAQVAVALTSGRMSEFVQAELSRLEAEQISRQKELKEARAELLERGEILQFWEGKMEDERNRGMEVEMDYHSAMNELEQEKTVHESALAEYVKQRAALDCQEQLLSSLRAEVTDMSEKLSLEKAKHNEEQQSVRQMRQNLQADCEKLVDTRSILEAEVEALRILRSWVEDEARKSQARAKVLKEAGRRWKWDS